MTDLAITAANVAAGLGAVTEAGTAGVAVTAGQVVYKEAATGQFKLADNDNAAAEVRTAYGIALHAAAAGQPLTVQRGGDLVLGATLVAGTDYYLSGTAGGIAPRADVTSTHDVVRIGMAKSTTVLGIDFNDPGVTL